MEMNNMKADKSKPQSELEVRANAMLQEIGMQRDTAMNRCAELAATVATLQIKIKEFEESQSKSKSDSGNGS